jgi:hypothetical protein
MEDDREPPLGHLRRDDSPPAELKGRVRRSLQSRALLGRPPWVRAGWALAASLAGLGLFAGGQALGRRASAPAAEGPRYALLLYDPAGFDQSIPEPTLVAEYREWAVSLRGKLSLGEKLGTSERVLPSIAPEGQPAAGPAGVLGGLFIVRAGSWEEAMAIARSCPHLKHGGVVAVRAIEET